jgi:hypothetical protein
MEPKPLAALLVATVTGPVRRMHLKLLGALSMVAVPNLDHPNSAVALLPVAVRVPHLEDRLHHLAPLAFIEVAYNYVIGSRYIDDTSWR